MAKYIKQEMPNMNGKSEPQVYYRLKTNRNINSKEFAEHICRNGSATNRAEVESVLIRLADGLAELLGNGYSVTIDGVGTFKAALGLKQDKEMDTFDGDETKRTDQHQLSGGQALDKRSQSPMQVGTSRRIPPPPIALL